MIHLITIFSKSMLESPINRLFIPALWICGTLFSAPTMAQTPVQSDSQHAGFDASEFDAYVQRAVDKGEVPGLAIVVVKDDSVVFAKGYGVRELGGDEPVDMNTLFTIFSNTKAMTAAALGMLVDEGKLHWDDPVVDHLPSFRLKDPNHTAQVRVRDLITHNAGLPDTDFLWVDPATSMDEILQRLPHVAEEYPIRSGFIYQNVMYGVAGEVIEAVSGTPWADFFQARIFEPVGMDRSVPTLAEASSRDNVARTHRGVGDDQRIVGNRSVDPVGPAGSAWSSAADMSRWIRFLLRGCTTENGHRLLHEETCEELFSPQTVAPIGLHAFDEITRPNWVTYGLGWFQQDYKGRKIDFHLGGGMGSVVGLMRDENLGVFVVGNRNMSQRQALMYRVFDLFSEGPTRDWSAEMKAFYTDRAANIARNRTEAEAELRASRAPNTAPSLPFGDYVGRYEHPLYGSVRVDQSADGLRWTYAGSSGRLEHWHYDTFRYWPDDPELAGGALTTFHLNGSGLPKAVTTGSMEFTRVEVPGRRTVISVDRRKSRGLSASARIGS